MRVALVLSVLVAAAAAVVFQPEAHNDTRHEYKQYIAHHRKHYDDKEFDRRHAIFAKRKAAIAAHNMRHKNGEVGWTQTLTRWSDMTVEEFVKAQGYKPTNGTSKAISAASYFTRSKRIDNIDWRSRMTGAKDQHGCGSCWAFATTGVIEGCIALSTNRGPPSLSEQQLQDCMFDRKCSPGGGGGADAIDWVTNNGINAEDKYPYTESDGQCHDDGMKWRSGGRVHGSNEDQLYDMLRNGPVLVGINAEPVMNYDGGVITDAGASRGRNHAVVVVGVQNDCWNGQACWIIRNSWGQGFGDNGHFKVLKGQSVIGLGDDSDAPINCMGSETGLFGDLLLSAEIWGNDIETVQASDAQDCQNQCYSYRDNACKSFAFDACGHDCWLKGESPEAHFGVCRISGKIASNRKTQGNFGVMDGADRVGSDLDGMPVKANDAQDCQNKCHDRGDCAAFVFNTCGGNDCWLKHTLGDPSFDTCRLSGGVGH